MLGLSSSYFGFKGKSIYDSVKSVFDLGFDAVELGAGHRFEEDIWETVKRIKADFPGKDYTIHGLFPPQRERAWFNASLGLAKQNKEIVDSFFRAGHIVEAKVVSIHPGFTKEIAWRDSKNPMENFLPQKDLLLESAWSNLFKLIEYCLHLAEETGCAFAIENVPEHSVPLVCSSQQVERVFKQFPKLLFLLDFGHALYEGRLQEFLGRFSRHIGQMHLHFSRPKGTAPKADEHTPITSFEQLEPLGKIRQLKEIPIVFEHGLNVSQAQILKEKELVARFLG